MSVPKYVIHYIKLKDRYERLVEQFESKGVNNYEFVTKYSREDLTDGDRFLFDTNSVRDVDIAIANSHLHALKTISENHDCALILEDDIVVVDDFNSKLDDYMSQLPSDYDMLFIGNGCNLHIEPHVLVPGKNVYKKGVYPTPWGGDGATRCTDSYVVTKKCAAQIIEYVSKLPKGSIKKPVDWWLNEVIRIHNFNVYWAEPTIVTQTSQFFQGDSSRGGFKYF